MPDSPFLLTPVNRFWRLLRLDRADIRNIYAYSIFAVLVNLSLPLGIQAIINLIQGGKVTTSWIVLILLVVLGVLITGILQIAQLRTTENLQQKIFTRAALEFSFRIPRIRMEALYAHYVPELMNRFFDVTTLQKGLAKMLIDWSTATLYIVFGLVLLSLYHPFFILFSLILILLLLAIFRLTIRRGLQTSLQESKHKYRVAYWLEEIARTHSTFKLAGGTDLPLQRTNVHVSDYLKERENHFGVLKQQYTMMVIFKALVTTGLLAIGGLLVMEQQMNIGQFVAAEIIILLVLNAVEKFILSMETVYDVLTALEKIGQVTDLPLESESGMDLREVSSTGGMALSLKSLSFRYPDAAEETLKDVQLDIPPGQTLLLTGSNGSGKTTLLNVLAGLYDIESGSIAFDGLPLGNLNRTALRSQIGDCLAQELIFQGTILENIAMGKGPVNFEEVRRVVAQLGLDDFIQRLPRGFDTVLEPQGRKLPAGIIRKILLARSIVDRPRLVLLEDVLDQMEPEERDRAIRFLRNKENGWTLVIASADESLAALVDRVVEIRNGCIVRDTRPASFDD